MKGFEWRKRIAVWRRFIGAAFAFLIYGMSLQAQENPGLRISDEQKAAADAQLAAVYDFIAKTPDSPEVPVLRAKLGDYFRDSGQFTRAMDEWSQAYALAQSRLDDRGREYADRALANYAR